MKHKLGFTAGIMNLILGGILFVFAVLFIIMAACCIMMSFSLFFMAAIPAFLVTGFLASVTLIAAAVNIAVGAGAVATSIKGGLPVYVVSIVSLVVDVAMLPVSICGLACGVFLMQDASFLSVFVLIISVLSVAAVIASTVLDIVCLKSRKSEAAQNA
ncbi:MAG: hypothetical protein K2M95_06830 [Clostridiales bacterium]|nr:hypothetical protein [Clostridiales bacterium]